MKRRAMTSHNPSGFPLKTITMISASRTGSTHALQLLERDFKVCNLLEAFHTNPETSRQHIRRGIGNYLDASGGDAEVEISLSGDHRADPIGALAHLKSAYGLGYIVVKVFPGHLEPSVLRALLSASYLVWVHRRPHLEAYLSNKKAQITGKYTNFDTTEILTEYDESEFLAFTERRVAFYDSSLSSITPETNIVCSDYMELGDAGLVTQLTAKVGTAGCLTSRAHSLRIPMLARQDCNDDIYAKVSNSTEMRESVRRLSKSMYV